MAQPLRVGIIGTGNIARAHVRALRSLEGRAEIVAATDIDPDHLQKFCGEQEIASAHPTVEQMLAQESLDLVHICTPPGGHADQAIACLEAGASVVCEKPPCLTLADFDRILEAEKRNSGHFITIFQHRFGSSGKHLKSLIDSGRLGDPYVAICHTLWFRGDAYYEVPWRGRWDTEGGGPTMGHGIHQIDLLGHLLGDWVEISATARRMARHVDTEDVSFAHVTFASGAVASIVNSILSPREESYLRFDFAKATVEVTHLYGYNRSSWKWTSAPGVEEELWQPPEPDVPSSHAAQLADVVDAIERGERPEPSGPTARRTLEIVAGLYASAFTGERVRREDLGPDHPFYAAMHGGRPDGAARA
ncbi:MAG TPA: Gfo/Idh/MocA family oxidoreductase [Mycobacteriales bacterium]|nr:Gfo/Idh/MocA family oxidoreductase [Mycobacteriales bacterium]